MNQMHRSKRLAVFFLSLVVLLGAILSCQKKSVSETAEASVVYLEGSLTMDGQRLHIGSMVKDNSLLQTSADSLAEIVFENKNILRMGASTSLRAHLASLERTLEIKGGTVTAVLHKLDRALGGKMNITTPSLVAGLRGTSFCVWVNGSSNETYFCTCNGRIEFIPGGTEKSIIEEASHHAALEFTGTGNNVKVSIPGPEINKRHTDSDLESLASKIGDKMDWGKIEE
jgi:Uncharacterized protein conserved in bacteria